VEDDDSEDYSPMPRNFYGGSKIMNIQVENGRAVGADMRPLTVNRESDIGSHVPFSMMNQSR
jgi:hypothetical protein